MKFLKEKLLLSEKGYSDLKKAIVACTLTNIALLLPAGVTTLLFWQLLNPFYGKDISWGNMWGLLIVGIIASLLVFLAARNDYRKTYLASYKEASNTRLRIAEHLRIKTQRVSCGLHFESGWFSHHGRKFFLVPDGCGPGGSRADL